MTEQNIIIAGEGVNQVVEINRDNFDVIVDTDLNIVQVDQSVNTVIEVALRGEKGEQGDQGVQGIQGEPGIPGTGAVVITSSAAPNSTTVVDSLFIANFRGAFWDVTLVESVTGQYMTFQIKGGHNNIKAFSSGKTMQMGDKTLKRKVKASVVLNGTELELQIHNIGTNFLQAKILQFATEEV